MKRGSQLLGLIGVVSACILFAGCGGGSQSSNSTATDGSTAGSTAGSTGATVGVDITGSHSFNPVSAVVDAGDTVRWTNTDTAHHTVTSDTGQSGLDSIGQYPSGLPGAKTFSWSVPANATSGTVYYYHCEFHGSSGGGTHIGSGMAGSITVR